MYLTTQVINIFMVNSGKEIKLPKNSYFEIVGKPENTEYLIETVYGVKKQALMPVNQLTKAVIC
jgi:hypothetical protein